LPSEQTLSCQSTAPETPARRPSVREWGEGIVAGLIRMEEGDSSGHLTPYCDHVMREHDGAYAALHASREAVYRLMEWRRSPERWVWKWPSPIATCHACAGGESVRVYDHQNNGWLTDAYKGRGGVLLLASPGQYRRMAFDPPPEREGSPASRRTIDRLVRLFRAGCVVDSAFVTVDPDRGCDVVSQEGHHRALAAAEAGIRLMPVYVYSTASIDPETLLGRVVSRYGLAAPCDVPIPRAAA